MQKTFVGAQLRQLRRTHKPQFLQLLTEDSGLSTPSNAARCQVELANCLAEVLAAAEKTRTTSTGLPRRSACHSSRSATD